MRDSDAALYVDWSELTIADATGRAMYRNAWPTSRTVTADNVVAPVAARRSRWKIANENNITLKIKGYHFERNFGHGKQHLSAALATLILLAYLVHTALPPWTNPTGRCAPSYPRGKRSSNTCGRSFSTSPSTPGTTCSTSYLMAYDRLRARPEAGQTRGRVKF